MLRWRQIGEWNTGLWVSTVETSSSFFVEWVACFLVRAGMWEHLGARIGV